MGPQSFVQCWDNYVQAIVTYGGISNVFINALDSGAHPEFREIKLLWDTGATVSMVSKRIVEAMQLVPIGQGWSCNSSGNILVDLFKINLLLPNKIEFCRHTQGWTHKILFPDSVNGGYSILISTCPEVPR